MEKIKISKHILSARTHHLNPIAIKKMRPQVLRAAELETPLNLDYARFDMATTLDLTVLSARAVAESWGA
jgi:hypothetical protein